MAANSYPKRSSTNLGNGSIASGQITVDTTLGGVQIVPARAGRNAVTIVNEGATDVRIGPQGLTAATGVLLVGVKGASITIPTSGAVYGITGGGGEVVSYVETFG